jgi:hypothetical protein
MFWTFFGISSTPMQPVTCNEFSLIIIVKQSILHWFNMKNTITCDRKGLHHDFEYFMLDVWDVFWYFFNTNATCHMSWIFSLNNCKTENSTLIQHENTITCYKKGLHHDLELFHARCFGRFLLFLQHQCNLSHVLSVFL